METKEPTPDKAEVPKTTTPDLVEKAFLVVRKPSVTDKPPEIKQESRGKRHWASLRKSISQVRWILSFLGQPPWDYFLLK